MKKFKVLTATMTAVALIGGFAGCSMIEKTPAKIEKENKEKNEIVLAQGKDIKITMGDVEKEFAPNLAMIKQQVPDINTPDMKNYIKTQKTNLADQLLKSKVYLAAANAKGYTPEHADVKKKIDELKAADKQNFPNEEDLKKALEQAGLTLEDYNKRVQESAQIDALFTEITKDNVVNDASIKNYYEMHKEDMFTKQPGANLFHIIFKDEAAAKEGKAKIDAGAKFEDIAKEYGQDGTKDKGGELGYYAYDNTQLSAQFMEHAKKLKEGEISDVVKTEFGYHIIKVTGVVKEAAVQPLEEVKDKIKDAVKKDMDKKTISENYTAWEKEYNVEKFFDRITE